MTTLQASTQNQLRQFIEQIERLEEEKRGIAEDIRDKFAEAKAVGFDVKIMRRLLKLRKMSKADRDEQDAVLDTYLHALGMLADTPLGEYAARSVVRSHVVTKEIDDEVTAIEDRLSLAESLNVESAKADAVARSLTPKQRAEAEKQAALRRADRYIDPVA